MYKKISQEDLQEVLEQHKLWLKTRYTNEPQGQRADLREADLGNANLGCANLRNANLGCADLRGADLREADLRDADLRDANLRNAKLGGADLRGADLGYADLRGANLGCADLRYADLRGANLGCANLGCADLRGANLECAKLGGANLGCADLRGANLRKVISDSQTSFYALQCPEEGNFIAYKNAGNKIIKLKIPADAKRSSATTRKCRASKAEVLAIENLDGSDSGLSQVSSNYDSDFIYTVGESVAVDNYEEDRWIERAPGIHFFITREEAVRCR